LQKKIDDIKLQKVLLASIMEFVCEKIKPYYRFAPLFLYWKKAWGKNYQAGMRSLGHRADYGQHLQGSTARLQKNQAVPA
jgi:hypothetical protein